MMLYRPLALLAAAAALQAVVCTSVAQAEVAACAGRNLLDEMKAKDAAAYSRIRTSGDAAKNGRTVFWKIESTENPAHPPSYLFGTLKISDDRLRALPTEVEEALATSYRIATGSEERSNERLQEAIVVITDALAAPKGAGLDRRLSASEAQRVGGLLKAADLPPDWLTKMKPWVASALAQASDCELRRLKEGKQPPEVSLAQEAENRGVGTVGLETTEMELSALAAIPDAGQMSLLKSSLAARDRLDDVSETLVQLYLARDLGALLPLEVEVARKAGADEAALQAYEQSVIEGRNIRMRDRALLHLGQGGVFIAVNAARLPGERGLVELFKEAGYTLTPLL